MPEEAGLGKSAELVAARYLESKGYRIEATNWKKSRFEIDIIATKPGLIAFVEVKASKKTILGPPELRVRREKQRRIIQAAQEFLAEKDLISGDIRFDVIGITHGEGKRPGISHVESAFTADPD